MHRYRRIMRTMPDVVKIKNVTVKDRRRFGFCIARGSEKDLLSVDPPEDRAYTEAK